MLNPGFRLRRRGVLVIAVVALVVAVGAGAVLADSGGLFDNAWPFNASGTSSAEANPVLAAVGDIACEPNNVENSGNPAALKCGSPSLEASTLNTRRPTRRMR